MNSLAHIEVNVSNLGESLSFYEFFLKPLGWKKEAVDTQSTVGFKAPDKTHLWLVQAEDGKGASFHRKHVGLNHIAFRVESKEMVERTQKYLREAGIVFLYHQNPKDYSKEYNMDEYYAVFFEDPDRIKIEIVYLK